MKSSKSSIAKPTELKILSNLEITNTHEQDVHRSACRKSFIYFLQFVKTIDSQRSLGVQPFPIDYPFLRRVGADLQNHRQNIILKARQMVITWLMAGKLIWRSNFNSNVDYPIISRNEDVAKEIKDRAWFIHNTLPDWLKSDAVETAFEIKWPNIRSRLRSLPCTMDVARSFSASNVMIDEGAFLKWGNIMFGAIRPIIDIYGGMDICSTPNLHDGLFYPLWHDKKSNFNKIEVHWTEHPLRDEAWAERMKADIGHTRWMQEYELSFEAAPGLSVFENWNHAQAMKCFNFYDPTKPLIRGFDRGYESPACLWGQLNSDDQLMGLHELQGNRIARDVWLREVKDTTDAMFPNHKGGYLDYAAADFLKAESDGIAWKKAMESFGIYIKAPKGDDIDRRVTAVRNRLPIRQDGKFGIIIDPDHCPILVAAMGGGYHLTEKPDFNGKYKPVKDEWSHLADCLEHICDNHWGRYEGQSQLQTIRLGRPAVKGVRRA